MLLVYFIHANLLSLRALSWDKNLLTEDFFFTERPFSYNTVIFREANCFRFERLYCSIASTGVYSTVLIAAVLTRNSCVNGGNTCGC